MDTCPRSLLTLLALFPFASIAPAHAAAPAPAADDWPCFRGPHGDGSYEGPPLSTSWKEGGPPVLWDHAAGEGFSGPVVADGKLVLFHRTGDQEVVECLEAATGKPVWKRDYPTHYRCSYSDDAGPRATPAIFKGRVYTFGAAGVLQAFDLASGEPKWKVDAEERFGADEGFFGLGSSPLVEGGRLLLNVGGKDGAGIVAFDLETGKTLWKATDEGASYSSPVAATIRGERHVLFFTRGALADLDPADGRVRSRFPFRARLNASVNAASPVVAGDRVFISECYGPGAALLRLEEGGPKTLWTSSDALSNHYATSIHLGGFLYGYDGRTESGPSLRCVELETGKPRWTEEGFGAGTALRAGEQLVLLTEAGELVIAKASPEKFAPLARARVAPRGGARAYPALAGGKLYVRSRDRLACFDLARP